MAGIAQVIAGVVQGVTSTITAGIDKADERYTARTLQGSQIRNQGALKRNLPVVIVGVVLFLMITIALVKK